MVTNSDQLLADGHVRGERRQRILRHHGGAGAAKGAELRGFEGENVGIADAHFAANDTSAGARVAEKRSCERRFAGT